MSSETIYSIYLITNLVNNKTYIGWTSRDPYKRYREHQSTRTPKRQARSAISCAIEKYGVENFEFFIIYQSKDYNHCRQIETHFIAEHRSHVEQWGYNKDLGGTGHKRSAETIEKHRQKIKGRKQSEEHKKKKGDAIRGEKNGMYGRHGEDNPNYGSTHTSETRLKISIAQKERIAKDKANGTYRHHELTDEEIEKMKETKRAKKESGESLKYKNIVIQDPSGEIIHLPPNYTNFFKSIPLNNFMTKCIKDPNMKIKGYSLISYEMNR